MNMKALRGNDFTSIEMVQVNNHKGNYILKGFVICNKLTTAVQCLQCVSFFIFSIISTKTEDNDSTTVQEPQL